MLPMRSSTGLRQKGFSMLGTPQHARHRGEPSRTVSIIAGAWEVVNLVPAEMYGPALIPHSSEILNQRIRARGASEKRREHLTGRPLESESQQLLRHPPIPPGVTR